MGLFDEDEGFKGEPVPQKAEEPWWNDGQKVSGMATTILILSGACIVAGFAFAVTIKLIFTIL